jgi:hypothetical protein
MSNGLGITNLFPEAGLVGSSLVNPGDLPDDEPAASAVKPSTFPSGIIGKRTPNRETD